MRNRWLRSTALFRALPGCWFLGFGGSLPGAPTSVSPAPSLTATQSVYLEYREANSFTPSFNWGIPVVVQSTSFTKEPDFGRRKVARGTLKFGDSTDHAVAFVWDPSQGKLHLDLNRNQDLTDDPEGVYACPSPAGVNYPQTFERVRLAFITPKGIHPVLVDLSFYSSGSLNLPPHVGAGCRSYWEGKVVLEGKEWQLGLTDNLQGGAGNVEGGELLLQPWLGRGRGHPEPIGSPDLLRFERNHLYFFGGQAFALECTYIQQDNHPKYRIDLKPQPAELGELKLTGQFISRLVLTRDGAKPLTAVLDKPGSVEKIPAGTYREYRARLQQGQTEACRTPDRYGLAPSMKPLVVSGRGPSLLELGGPLTNVVAVNRRGKSLVLNYQLVGAGGETYELPGPRQPPEFAVYQAQHKVASGAFEFG